MRLTLFTEFLTSLWSSSSPSIAMEFEDSIAAPLVSVFDTVHTMPATDGGATFDGCLSTGNHSDDSWGAPGSFESHLLEPAFNIDGTPMLGSFDIHGNPYGVTESCFEDSLHNLGTSGDFDSGGMFGSSDHTTSWSTDSFGGSSDMGCGSSSWD